MIAALAVTNRLELVTGNMSHYQRLPQIGYALTLTNWRV
jgi:tRNA(fMet)-specific endonuclease VapC